MQSKQYCHFDSCTIFIVTENQKTIVFLFLFREFCSLNYHLNNQILKGSPVVTKAVSVKESKSDAGLCDPRCD